MNEIDNNKSIIDNKSEYKKEILPELGIRKNSELLDTDPETRIIFELMFKYSLSAKMVVDVETNRFLKVNQKMADLMGYSIQEMEGENAISLGVINQESVDTLKEIFFEMGSYSGIEVEMFKKNKEKAIFLLSGEVVKIKDREYLVQTMADITKIKLVEQALIESEEKLRKSEEIHREIISNIAEVVGIIDSEGRMTFTSPNVEKFFGWSPEDLINVDVWTKVHPDDLDELRKKFRNITLDKKKSVTADFRFLCKEGNYRYVELTANNLLDNPNINGILVSYRDISRRKADQERIQRLSSYDLLTNLYNRAYFESELKKMDNESSLPLSIMVIDVDGLKLSNDAFGHLEGDNLLKTAADTLKKVFKDRGVVARWGGDEFMALVPNASASEAEYPFIFLLDRPLKSLWIKILLT